MAAQFIPAADEVYRLKNGRGPECDLFRIVAEQGHYAGREQPSGTRQGVYLLAPSGKLLASANTNGASSVRRLMEHALSRWEELPDEDRYLDSMADADTVLDRRWKSKYPRDGLVLRVVTRDLKRTIENIDSTDERLRWRADHLRQRIENTWNMDYAWFTADEMRSLIPHRREVGATRQAPSALIKRVARLHIIDNVRGQTPGYAPREVKQASLNVRISAIEGDVLVLDLAGDVHSVHAARVNTSAAKREQDRARANRRGQRTNPEDDERGVDVILQGAARFDTESQRFISFDMLAIGERWGGTQHNNRWNDMDRNGIGYSFTLAENDPPVAPAMIAAYGW